MRRGGAAGAALGLGLLLGCSGGEDTAVDVPGDLLSVSESASGRLLFIDPDDGRYRGELCLSEALPELCPLDADEDERCLLFAAEHERVGGESTFRLTHSRLDPDVPHAPSGLASVTAGHPTTVRWRLDHLSFPEGTPLGARCAEPLTADCYLNGTHVFVEADDGVLVAADTNNSRVLWIQPGEDGAGEVLAVLGPEHPSWDGWRNVNHLQLLEAEDGRALLLLTIKARQVSAGQLSDQGQLLLWDVTDRAAPSLLWAWPGGGFVAAVHHGVVQDTAQGALLLYAHSLGASDDPDTGQLGSVGFARYNGPDTPPTYLADGVLPEGEVNPLGFVREVELFSPDDGLLITDSGCENSSDDDCRYPGRLLSAALPDGLTAEGQSGSLGDQRFVELDLLPDAQRHQLVFPYEADLFYADEVDAALVEGIGGCED